MLFQPKLLTVLQRGYTRQQATQDIIAGLTVGIVAVPLAIAFAIASGVKPEQGFYTAIVGGLLVSLLGGSRVQIAGPTGAFIVIVLGIVQSYGYAGLATATLLAGLLLIAMGVLGLGRVIRYIPYPVTVGFTSGIALVIATTQIPDFLGLQVGVLPSEYLEKLSVLASHIGDYDPRAFTVGLATIIVVVGVRRYTPKLPAMVVALLLATVVCQVFGINVETVGSRFGVISTALPAPVLPDLSIGMMRELISPAISIALLGAIESLLSAVVADGMIGGRHRSNTELIAQGAANIASPLFGGIPVTGAIARTATNVKAGGRTPVAGIVHAFVVLAALLVIGPAIAMIPMATLAGILLVVAWQMSEMHLFVSILRSLRGDAMILLSTFMATLLVDLVFAVQFGVVLASLLFMKRMSDVFDVTNVAVDGSLDEHLPVELQDIPNGVTVFEINGPFFFGAAQRFSDALSEIQRLPDVVVFRMRHVPSMDLSGVRVFARAIDDLKRQGIHVILSGLHDQPLKLLRDENVIGVLGSDGCAADLVEAIRLARAYLAA